MKRQLSPRFRADWARLDPREREMFERVVRGDFVPACERWIVDRSARWPASLRVRRIARAPGIWEMTWSFSGPDGRATFEWIAIDGEPGIRWRRIGGHAVFGDP